MLVFLTLHNNHNHPILCFRDEQFYFVSFLLMDVVSSLNFILFHFSFRGGGGVGWDAEGGRLVV